MPGFQSWSPAYVELDSDFVSVHNISNNKYYISQSIKIIKISS